MRQGSKKGLDSASKAVGQGVGERLAEIEKRVFALEGELADMRDAAGGGTPAWYFPAKAKGAGRPQKIDDATLSGQRDRLIDWLEAVWPSLEPELLAGVNAAEVRRALEGYAQYGHAKHLMDHAEALAAFLDSGRWFMPPKSRLAAAFGSWATPEKQAAAQKAAMSLPARQIACAMAGLPELSWRTSFTRAQRDVCMMAVRSQTEEFYRIKFKLPWPKPEWERARRGESSAQYHLGLCFQHGIGVEPDPAKAAEWFERGAMQGDSHAQMALADVYRTGQGRAQSSTLAFLWASQVPHYPAMEPWLAEITEDVPRKELEHLTGAARELRTLIFRFQDGRGIRLTVPPTADARAIFDIITMLIRSTPAGAR